MSAAVIVTVYTPESYSSATIQAALVRLIQSAFSLIVDIERYGKQSIMLRMLGASGN